MSSKKPIEKIKNNIIFILVVITGLNFLGLSYHTDTLGKFTQNDFSDSDVVAPLGMDSYGNPCSPNYNYGDRNYVLVKKDSSECRFGASSGDRQAYLMFDIPFMNSHHVEKATLFIKVNDGSSGEFIIYPIERYWEEDQVRWNGPLNNYYWSSPGLGYNDIREDLSVKFSLGNDTSGYTNIDITEIVNYWLDNENNGLVIKPIEGVISFNSKESGDSSFIVIEK